MHGEGCRIAVKGDAGRYVLRSEDRDKRFDKRG